MTITYKQVGEDSYEKVETNVTITTSINKLSLQDSIISLQKRINDLTAELDAISLLK